MADKQHSKDNPISRREMLKMAGVGGIGLLLGGTGVGGLLSIKDDKDKQPNRHNKGTISHKKEAAISFYGQHQAGITTPAQNFICFGAFDVTTKDVREVKKLLQAWTKVAVVMSNGQMIGETNEDLNLPPSDTGEAAGLSTSRLMITFGAGASLFDKRFGLAAKRPAAFPDLPVFLADNLQPQWCGGDLCIQVCADDVQVAFHALRNFVRIAQGTAVLRWTQEGFQRSTQADPLGSTPRNLLGFKDGTGNPDTTDEGMMNKVVWVQPNTGAAWMEDGTYMVVRKIRMRIEVWDRSTLKDQEDTF